MDPTIHYYLDAPVGRRQVFRCVEEVARAMLDLGGLVGVQIVGARSYERELTGAELHRLGHAIREARAERSRELEDESRALAARLGLAA